MRAVREQVIRVAIVDDDSDLAASIAGVMRAMGLLADPFEDAESLLGVHGPYSYDAYVVDWNLKQGTAEELLRRLHAHPCSQGALRLLLSGSLCERMRAAAAEFGFVYRRKPISIRSLAGEVVAHVEARAKGAAFEGAEDAAPGELHGGQGCAASGRRRHRLFRLCCATLLEKTTEDRNGALAPRC
jgi:DNA-binding response OmpR family regulator